MVAASPMSADGEKKWGRDCSNYFQATPKLECVNGRSNGIQGEKVSCAFLVSCDGITLHHEQLDVGGVLCPLTWALRIMFTCNFLLF